MTMSINQILVALLVLALFIMAGTLVVLAMHAVKMMNNANELIDNSKEMVAETKQAADEALAEIKEGTPALQAMAMFLTGALAVKATLSNFKTVNKIRKGLKAARKG
ncbi:MAG: hypothetical protein HUJ78_03800 [Mogibacterium sp.]|nr:hypothetical protein [Mogibacterium sp.]